MEQVVASGDAKPLNTAVGHPAAGPFAPTAPPATDRPYSSARIVSGALASSLKKLPGLPPTWAGSALSASAQVSAGSNHRRELCHPPLRHAVARFQGWIDEIAATASTKNQIGMTHRI